MHFNGRKAGFSLVELVIAVVLMAFVLGLAGMISKQGIALFRTNAAINTVDSLAIRSLDRVAREVMAATSTSFVPTLQTPVGNPTVWSSTLDFQEAVGWNNVAGTVVLGPTRRIVLQLAAGEINNGVDDNGDGLIDEGSVTLVENVGQPDQMATVLVNGVSEFFAGEVLNGVDDNGNGMVDEQGFCFDAAGGTLNFQISIERIGPDGGLLIRTHSDSIRLRN